MDSKDKASEEKKELSPQARKDLRLMKAIEAQEEIKSRMVMVISTALALVAALFWQTAITDTIKTFIPISGAWGYEIVVATIITLAAAVIIYFISSDNSGNKVNAKK